MSILGLDLGTKNIGIAATDDLSITAQPVSTLRRSNLSADLRALAALARERAATGFVVGLPLNMNGSEGAAAAGARKFAESLERHSGLPVEFVDERLTTVAANRAMLEANVSRKRRRASVDKVAAVLILQTWLDARK